MNIFVTSISLIFIGIAMIYPVFFMSVDKQIQKGAMPRQVVQNSYVIHLIAATVSIILYWIYSVSASLQIAGSVYLVAALVIVLFYWNTELTKWNLFTASIIFGFIVFYRSINEIVEITPLWPGILTGLLSSGILSILILLLIIVRYDPRSRDNDNSMIIRLVKYLSILLGIRIFWGVVILFNLSVATHYGDVISALKFFWQVDSLKLSTMIITGMLIPLIYIVAFRSKISNINTKYRFMLVLILFIAVLTSEFISKYFLLQFGIVI